MRKPAVDRLATRQDEDIDNFVSFVTKDSIQKSLAKYLEALKRKNWIRRRLCSVVADEKLLV